MSYTTKSGVRHGATILVAGLGLALLTSQCKSAVTVRSQNPNRACTSTSDCDGGWLCVANVCAKACNNALDCPDKTDDCVSGYCAPVAIYACSADNQCLTPPVCFDAGGAQCYAGQCHYLPSPAGLECNDNSLCTIGDHCDGAGSCVGTNPCSQTLAGRCVDDTDYLSYYGAGSCNPTDGSCSYVSKDLPCPNCTIDCLPVCAGVDCVPLNGGCMTAGYCDPTSHTATCVYSNAATGSACTYAGGATGTCSNSGECLAQCTSQAQCDDGNPCTTDTCDSGLCHNAAAAGGTCGDATGCTLNSVCKAVPIGTTGSSAGLCVGAALPDGTECGSRSCLNLSWNEQTCQGGRCTGTGQVKNCDEGIPCKSDTCDPVTGCAGSVMANGASCGTTVCAGLNWNQPVCASGACTGSTLKQNCNDNNACTNDSCNDGSGCTNATVADNTECGSRSCSALVWNKQTCQAGVCNGTAQLQNCDDGNGCTTDTCTPATGCTNVNNTAECGSRSCNGLIWNMQQCQNGACTGSSQVQNCNDNNACTTDSCSPSAGCTNSPVTNGTECGSRSCNGLVWNKQTCLTGVCNGSAQLQNCDDGNTCTTDTCTPATGCTNSNNTSDCGTCAICSTGACVADLSQNGDCPVCQICTGLKTCGNESSGQDVKVECAVSGSPTCHTGSCNGAGACGNNAVTCYPDADQDGFTSGTVVVCAPCNGTTQKTAPSAQSDCCDSDNRAYPGETAYYTVPDNCGSWDYNCDGTTTVVPATYQTDCYGSGVCTHPTASTPASMCGYDIPTLCTCSALAPLTAQNVGPMLPPPCACDYSSDVVVACH